MNTPLSIAGAIAAFLAISSISTADRVFLTNTAGCPVDIGFRVQYSDLAQLKWVQLQVLGADNSLIEGLDNSTQAQWDDKRTKTVTWTVPNDWPTGDYVIRAFGNAQGCPSPSNSSSSPSSFSTGMTTPAPSSNKDAPPSGGNSAESYRKSNQELFNQNLAAEKKSSTETTNGMPNNDSSLVQKTIDQSAVPRVQDQTILNVQDEIRDYNIQKLTLTLKNKGEVIPMSEWMDSATIARFIQTLELSLSTLHRQSGKGNMVKSSELVSFLHKNSFMIVIPPVSPASTATPFNYTEINPFGRELVQHEEQDQDQIQDKKSNDASSGGNKATSMTTQGLFAAVLAAVVGTMTL
ncbi:hypothetical protein BGX23_007126 [Mortierella sp. AD031]|nr:hypothetical protein BGX23_007126 [Mortierella sp. AD031]